MDAIGKMKVNDFTFGPNCPQSDRFRSLDDAIYISSTDLLKV